MSRNNRDRSFDEPRLPQGTLVLAALAVILLAGIFLILQGLV
jgi:hypothetical protein